MRPDIPIIGRPRRGSPLLSTWLFAEQARKIVEQQNTFERMRKIAALRRSCDVETRPAKISINIPRRYDDRAEQ